MQLTLGLQKDLEILRQETIFLTEMENRLLELLDMQVLTHI